MKKLACALLLASTAAINAYAGNESHGGNVLLCPGQDPVVLDYYNAALPSLEDTPIEQISGLSADEVIALFRHKLAYTALGAGFEGAFRLIGDYRHWPEASNLVDVNDQGLEYPIPDGCSLKQAAIRQGSEVLIDREVATAISPPQLGMLVVHEVLYYVAAQNGEENSSQVRNAVRQLMRKSLSPADLYNATSGLGVMLFWQQSRDIFSKYSSGMAAFVSHDDPHKPLTLKITWLATLNEITVRIHHGSANAVDVQGHFLCAEDDSCQAVNGSRLRGVVLRFITPNRIEVRLPGRKPVVVTS